MVCQRLSELGLKRVIVMTRSGFVGPGFLGLGYCRSLGRAEGKLVQAEECKDEDKASKIRLAKTHKTDK